MNRYDDGDEVLDIMACVIFLGAVFVVGMIGLLAYFDYETNGQVMAFLGRLEPFFFWASVIFVVTGIVCVVVKVVKFLSEEVKK